MANDQSPNSDVPKANAQTEDGAAPREVTGNVANNEAKLSNAPDQQASDLPTLANESGASTADANIVVADLDDLLADNDLLAAVTSLPPDVLSSMDLALDQLTTSVDLFDVPGLDLDDASQT